MLAETVTLTLQSAAEALSRDLPWDICERRHADARIAAMQRLIEDRTQIMAAIDTGRVLPRDVLERHGWLAVREARLNARDAPDSWDSDRAARTASAAAHGADWLTMLGIPQPAAVA